MGSARSLRKEKSVSTETHLTTQEKNLIADSLETLIAQSALDSVNSAETFQRAVDSYTGKLLEVETLQPVNQLQSCYADILIQLDLERTSDKVQEVNAFIVECLGNGSGLSGGDKYFITQTIDNYLDAFVDSEKSFATDSFVIALDHEQTNRQIDMPAPVELAMCRYGEILRELEVEKNSSKHQAVNNFIKDYLHRCDNQE